MVDVIIGVDCATQARKVGLARAQLINGRFQVTHAVTGQGAATPLEVVETWIGSRQTVLLALDAPLGWPSALGRALSTHRAGDPVRVPSNLLFGRITDRLVAERTGKNPLDVGADRIARTAHWALLFLDELRRGTGEAIPLAWGFPLDARVMAIEVYPAATLTRCGADLRGYRQPQGVDERESVLQVIRQHLDCDSRCSDSIGRSADVLDAAACVLAAVDFVDGKAVPPEDLDIAAREGWIWVR